jgi:hypothetical protein
VLIGERLRKSEPDFSTTDDDDTHGLQGILMDSRLHGAGPAYLLTPAPRARRGR